MYVHGFSSARKGLPGGFGYVDPRSPFAELNMIHLAGFILTGLESPMSPFEFRKVVHGYALRHVNRLLDITSYNDTVAAHSGKNDPSEMRDWIARSLLPAIWSPSMADIPILPVSNWLDFELIAPIVMAKYHVSFTLYAFGATPDSVITILYRMTGREEMITILYRMPGREERPVLSIETLDRLSAESATLPQAVTLDIYMARTLLHRQT